MIFEEDFVARWQDDFIEPLGNVTEWIKEKVRGGNQC